jgi:hypothetical protein
MNPPAGNVSAPCLGSGAQQSQVVRERLAREPALAHEWDLILNARLVARMPYTSGVDEEVARLSVLRERRIDSRVLRAGADDGGARVVEHDAPNYATEEQPGGVEPIHQCLGRLQERRPYELVAAHRQRDDEHVQLAALAVGACDVAH